MDNFLLQPIPFLKQPCQVFQIAREEQKHRKQHMPMRAAWSHGESHQTINNRGLRLARSRHALPDGVSSMRPIIAAGMVDCAQVLRWAVKIFLRLRSDMSNRRIMFFIPYSRSNNPRCCMGKSFFHAIGNNETPFFSDICQRHVRTTSPSSCKCLEWSLLPQLHISADETRNHCPEIPRNLRRYKYLSDFW